MNRRTALFSSLTLGGLVSRAALAQQGSSRSASEPPFRPDGAGDSRTPEGFDEPGHRWNVFTISRYTGLPHSPDTEKPEAALVDWILRTTGPAVWRGEALTAISASESQLRVYNNEKVLGQVQDVVKRFVDPLFDQMTLRVRVVVAADPRWRYAVYSQLEPKATGPMGQQAWLVDLETTEMAMAQMGISQNFRKLYDKRHQLLNGQTLFVKVGLDRDYVAGLEKASNSSLGFEQKVSKLEEGVDLRVSPLLNYDGTAVDLAFDLKAVVVRKLHSTRVIAPRKIGPAEMAVDVPEMGGTRMNQAIGGWPLDRTLAVSAGVLPGILAESTGFFSNVRLPGTGAGANELLVLLDLSTRLGAARDEDDARSEGDPAEEEGGDDPQFSALDEAIGTP